MRLLSATARNYRVHEGLTVEFDPERTVVGGPNECGKSTLAEAIHRALFLRATVTGDALDNMSSTLFSGRPEVEVRFAARGNEYELTKRFSGQTGTARLTQIGGPTWQGEEAEARVAALLGVDETGGGKGVLDRVKRQWAHLWVWQGQSGADFSDSVEAQQAGLLRRLQEVGGAVAMQSALDSRVASTFAQSRNQIFGKSAGGAALKNSELGRAQAERALAEESRIAAAERVDKLRQAMDAYEQADESIKRAGSIMEGIDRERKDLAAKLAEVTRLRDSENSQARDVADATEKVAALESVEKNLTELREARAEAQRSLDPLEARQRELESRVAEVSGARLEAEHAYKRATEDADTEKPSVELAAAYVTQFQKEATLRERTAHMENLSRLQKELDEIRAQLASLVAIDEAGLDQLRAQEGRLAQASAALKAMAAEVEVVAADQTVLVGGLPLSTGQHQVVSDTTEVRVGDSVRLSIHPGGGDALSRAREEVRTLDRGLRQALNGYGLGTLAEASEVVARRANLQSRARVKEAELGQWGAMPQKYQEAQEEYAAVSADIERRREQAGSVEPPETLAQAETLLARARAALQSAESQERSLRIELDGLQQQASEREDERNLAREALDRERTKDTELAAQVELLLQNHGPDEERAKRLQDGRDTKAKLESDLSETREALAELQPDLLEADKQRLERAWKEADDRRQEAEKARAVSRSTLRSDGAEDPGASLSQAEARLEAARKHLVLVDRKARAIALVDSLFQEEQRVLADRFSKPLADKIDAYLRCVFGAEARVTVAFADNRFTGVRLARSAEAGATPFDSLSEGAREQVAAAVRLAIAELLAVDHDGTLPMVFDDSFAYSDPERVKALQRMLDLGASRGLQVIVFTCNPADYAGLGARQVSLDPPSKP